MPDSQVTDNSAHHRFELRQDGATAFLLYRRQGSSLQLIHTEVPDALRGKGVGSKLVEGVLRLAQQQKLSVVPLCPFVADFLKRHPQYLDVVDPVHRLPLEKTKI